DGLSQQGVERDIIQAVCGEPLREVGGLAEGRLGSPASKAMSLSPSDAFELDVAEVFDPLPQIDGAVPAARRVNAVHGGLSDALMANRVTEPIHWLVMLRPDHVVAASAPG